MFMPKVMSVKNKNNVLRKRLACFTGTFNMLKMINF